MNKYLLIILLYIIFLPVKVAFAGPASTQYELVEYGFGNGSTEGNTGGNTYQIFGNSGEQGIDKPNSGSFAALLGLIGTMQANVPPAPTFTNPSSYYNKLLLTINQGNNPSDTLYAISISTDNFSSDIRYVQSDNTIGSTYNLSNFQSYSAWGSGSGFLVIGLNSSTTYYVRVSALQGDYTHSPFGPVASAATVGSTLSFDIDIASTDSETAAPYTLAIGTLTPASVTTATNRIWFDFTTNAAFGGTIYVTGTNGGLNSTGNSYTISSATTNLASASEGYGAISASVTQSSGGPMLASTPYNNSADNVGVIDTSKRTVYTSSNAPVTGGRVSLSIKAKSSSITPAASDYQDVITAIATANF